MLNMTSKMQGALATAAGAGFWGLFWIPLRHLDQSGIPGLWAVALTLSTSLIIALPVTLWKGRHIRRDIRWIAIVGISIGFASVLYFAAVIFSDVIRVIFLFYMLPVWATLTTWLLHGDRIRRRQMLAILIALTGLYLLLGGDGGLPVPRNLGDWCGLGSGFLWGLSLTLIRGNSDIDPYAASVAPFLIGAPVAIILGTLLLYLAPGPANALPATQDVVTILPLAILFGCLLLWPSMFGMVWGARLISPPTAALLTMTEILVATVSAWLLIGSSLTLISVGGGALILLAAIIDLTANPEALPDNQNARPRKGRPGGI